MKINKLIAAAMSIAIVGGTMPFISNIAPETIITASAEEESIFAGVKIADSENAKVYYENDSESFNFMGRTYNSGIVLSRTEDNTAFIELDISDINTISFDVFDFASECSRQYKNIGAICNVFVDDKMHPLKRTAWDVMDYLLEPMDVSGKSKLRIEITEAAADIAVCNISTDKGVIAKPVIPEYKSNAELLKSNYANQNVDIYTGEDKDRSFKVCGRTYYQGIVLKPQGKDNDNKENMAYIYLNVENIDKLTFSYGCVSNSKVSPAKNDINVLKRFTTDYALTVNDLYGHESKWSRGREGLLSPRVNGIFNCEVDVSQSEIICISFLEDPENIYAIMNIQADGMPLEAECVVPECNSTADFLKNAYGNFNGEIYTGEDKTQTFTDGEKVYDQGYIFNGIPNEYNNLNYDIIHFNTEDIDHLSFTVRYIGDDRDEAAKKELFSLCTETVSGKIIDNRMMDVDLSEPLKFDYDLSDVSMIRIVAEGIYGKFAITDIEVTPEKSDAEEVIYGDANEDKSVDLSDAVLIMQSLANPSKFKLTDHGKKNADCSGNGDGITNSDALSIQKYLLKIIDKLPESRTEAAK